MFQHDTAAGAGAGQEAKEYYERTGERTRWTNSIFGGMPTYQMAPSYDSTDTLKVAEKAYHLFLPSYVWLTFIMMLGFYILLRCMGVSAWLSALGGIIWAFSSYFFILISAGHIWKFITLAYIPPTIAGIVLTYRKKYLLGGVLTALFLALQVLSNHVQMSYYFLFVILLIAGAFFEDAWRNKELPHFFKASGILIVAAIVGISVNLSNLYHTYEYSKETMRGKSELKQEGPAANQTSSGLDRRSSGGSSRAMRNPKPRVTADTPSGSMKTPSRTTRARRPSRLRVRRVTTNATRTPSSSDIDTTASQTEATRCSACNRRRTLFQAIGSTLG